MVRSPFDGELDDVSPVRGQVDKRDDGAWAVVAGGHLLEVFHDVVGEVVVAAEELDDARVASARRR